MPADGGEGVGLGLSSVLERLRVRQMPSAHRRSFMHEEDGAGKDPVPPDKKVKVGGEDGEAASAPDAVKRKEEDGNNAGVLLWITLSIRVCGNVDFHAYFSI